DAFFFGLLNKGFNSIFRATFGALIKLLLGNSGERLRTFQENTHGPDQPHGHANQRDQRYHPTPGGAIKQHVRDEMHQDHDFQAQKDAKLDKRFPGARNEVDDAAGGFQDEKGEPEMPEDAESAAATPPIDFELCLDFGFSIFKVLW